VTRKELGLEGAPYRHDERHSELLEPQIRKLMERGVYTPPDGSG